MRRQIIVLSLFLSILGSLIIQSQYYSGDMVVHIQFINQLTDSSLYSKDYTNNFSIQQKSSSLYYPLMAFITNTMPFDSYIDFRIMYFIYLNILFAGLLFVSYELVGSLTVGVIWMLLLMTKVHIGGAAIETIETDVVPRAVSIALLVWSYFLFLKKRQGSKVVLVIISLAVHVLTGIYAMYFYLLNILLRTLGKRNFIGISSILLVGSSAFIFISSKVDFDKSWLEILQFRNDYAFLDLWSVVDWINLFILLLPGIVGMYWLPSKWQKVKKLFKFLVFGSLLISLVHIFFTTFIPQWQIIILQTGRIWIFPVYVSLLLGAGLAANFITNQKIKAIALLILATCISLYVVSKHTIGRESWIEVQKWAKSNTGSSCVFLTPFYNTGFRVESERAIAGDIKDGTLSFYSEDFAVEWKKRYDKLQSWEALPLNDLDALQKEYGFNYIVTSRTTNFNLPLFFKNENYAVYQIASTETCQQ